MASRVTAPLRFIPQLRDCHIRLGKISDSILQQTARDGVLQACRIAPYPSKPSTATHATFTGLPCELRLRILEYTDLIVPNKEVTWSRQDQRYTISADVSLRQFFRCRDSRGPRSSVGCFCRRRHSAFSFMCKCWAPPGPTLFLICRTLCRDAELIFFSGNRFIIHDYKSDPRWEAPFVSISPFFLFPGGDPEGSGPHQESQDYPSDRLAASQFLREVVPTHCLDHLRFLELVFPGYLARTWPQAGHPAMQDWRETVDWLRGKINARGLTLRLIVAGGDLAGQTGCAMPSPSLTPIPSREPRWNSCNL